MDPPYLSDSYSSPPTLSRESKPSPINNSIKVKFQQENKYWIETTN